MANRQDKQFQFEISLSVLNHLGRNLYRNFVTVLGEAISNSWDADAKNVWITIDREKSSFSIKDDGKGMDAEAFQNQFLKVGYSKRKDGQRKSDSGRPYIGAKGIGKLALLSCAQRISIFTKVAGGEFTGGVIDNTDLDAAIQHDNTPDEYPLEALNYELIKGLTDDLEHGTIIYFEKSKDQLRNSDAYIKKLLALSFKFSILDSNFNIHVNGDPVGISDLADLSRETEFLWNVNKYSDDFVKSLDNLKEKEITVTTPLNIKGFLATVRLPRHLKITGTEERATVDLFVNGRLREKNIIRHIPTQRIVESYLYGQIHFDTLDREGFDPFTSSREGIVEDDTLFQSLLEYLKNELIPKVLDEWDKLRLDRGEEGDDENTRKTKKQRKARDLYNASREEYTLSKDDPERDTVDSWLDSLRNDAEFNLTAYVDCFLSENLIRKYIHQKQKQLPPVAANEISEWKKRELDNLGKANISFQIRKGNDDLGYLGMDHLALIAEGTKSTNGKQSLWSDATNFKPVRNAVGHTGLLTELAKAHLNLTFQNIKSRVISLLSGK
ncbi:DNA mismatch repair protein [Brucella anthropi]|uniref:ATP-binding protein n=1 Tax=Brucella/Ochrobactrum group TaxID=2826938 RepID=UPI00124D2357|nr:MULTISPECIES: ATP-binding protein [Brucella/Ochrobactrum group]KAB2764765.1 DNA mismatch repair protein [Brucella anthropi]KAB2782564.1 DNA mismatch repair protein [Brucella anthropi]MCQ9143307.1 ATP-binding protein [Ochrobactrum sp. BTU2]UGQ23845.1 ATP-binding protein [Brucella anthropi]